MGALADPAWSACPSASPCESSRGISFGVNFPTPGQGRAGIVSDVLLLKPSECCEARWRCHGGNALEWAAGSLPPAQVAGADQRPLRAVRTMAGASFSL